MPKPKGKAGPSRGRNKNFKHRSAPKSATDYIPESAIDRGLDDGEPEDSDSTSSKIKIDVSVAMWVCKTTMYGVPHDLPSDVRISVIAIRNAAQERNSLALG